MKLRGKKALITGSAKRVGRALALALAREGCDIAIHYCSSEDEAKDAAKEICNLGQKAAAFRADFIDPSAPRKLAESATSFLGGLDILVNNACYWPSPEQYAGQGGILNENIEQWERSLAIGARAPFFLIQACAPFLSAANGAIVNILDSSVRKPFRGRAAHSISKQALMAVSQLAAETLGPTVRVIDIVPTHVLPSEGMLRTEIAKKDWIGAKALVNEVLQKLSQ